MKLKLNYSFLVAIFAFHAWPTSAMDDFGDKENMPPLVNQKVSLSDPELSEFKATLFSRAVSLVQAKEIINAVKDAAAITLVCPAGKKRKLNSFLPQPELIVLRPSSLTAESPKTPPQHARGVLHMGKGDFYETATPTTRKVERSRLIPDGEEKVDININAIYSWMFVKSHEEHLIPAGELIDMRDWLPQEKPHSWQMVHDALLHAEIEIRRWILKDPRMVARTSYVGLSKNTSDRIYGHRADLRSALMAFSSRKVRITRLASEHGFNIRMRALLHHIPDDWLPTFECLVAQLFSSHAFGGSAVIGNNQAWENLKRYWESQERIDKLTNLNLLTIAEDIEQKLFMLILSADN